MHPLDIPLDFQHPEFMGEVYEAVERLANVTRSDAQGIVDCQGETVLMCLARGYDEERTAREVLKAGKASCEKRAKERKEKR